MYVSLPFCSFSLPFLFLPPYLPLDHGSPQVGLRRDSCFSHRQMGKKPSAHSLARTGAAIDLRLLLQRVATFKPVLPLSWVETASLATPAVCSSV